MPITTLSADLSSTQTTSTSSTWATANIFTQILREGASADGKRKETPNDISMDDEWIYRKKPETKSEKAWTKNKGSFPARDVFYAKYNKIAEIISNP